MTVSSIAAVASRWPTIRPAVSTPRTARPQGRAQTARRAPNRADHWTAAGLSPRPAWPQDRQTCRWCALDCIPASADATDPCERSFIKHSFRGTPPGGQRRLMAGLLTRGSWLAPPSRLRVGSGTGGRSPLTVAGAVVDLAPVGYTAPHSLFTRPRVVWPGTIVPHLRDNRQQRQGPLRPMTQGRRHPHRTRTGICRQAGYRLARCKALACLNSRNRHPGNVHRVPCHRCQV